ncbi:redox-regulated ATPase YchF [Candidatus Hydrogenosomobacter endosymbioticus]|uniref:Ribosome-binding ATPase YchF n=1 Tax=Candidatus Hydrogenosomobacter endosymbioticus TaxID=2558174 RepID=A0ABM7V9W1_9PROT|nr:redox-regulated ATPase YchF [Candidatus Hydrogenosomobacter endosymbioticus]BDB96568.1 ribosome-binding ATPase YchF [Candidatus Hydrogenosomobacter endosymbioticus]
MGFECGIVGLPNAGKSTLFNAITATSLAQTASYPFCTIDPNKGSVNVPDNRLEMLARLAGSKIIIPSQIRFVDIAGLVKGASQGEGLGNQFLGHIREVDVIVHVVRCFEENVEQPADPVSDVNVIETELLLADLQSIEKQLANKKKKRGEDPEMIALMEKTAAMLADGKILRREKFSPEEASLMKQLHLLTIKPAMYVGNVPENDASAPKNNKFAQKLDEFLRDRGEKSEYVCAQFEAESAVLDYESRKEFLQSIGLNDTKMSSLIRLGYELLNLRTFFTIGPKEAHAWTIKAGDNAAEAAGAIHSDFQRGFISAEVISYEDYEKHKTHAEIKAAGKLRTESRDYIVQDGDVILFRFNV